MDDHRAFPSADPVGSPSGALGRRRSDKPSGLTPIGSILRRFVRLRDAPAFFGMDKNLFNRDVRPLLTEIHIGKQGRAFDRLEMEAAAEEYKMRIPVDRDQ